MNNKNINIKKTELNLTTSELNLGKRLNLVAKLIEPTDCLIDIGCDHGKMLDYVLSSNKAKFVIGSDISEKSAKKAHDLLNSLGYKNFSIVTSNGFEEFDNEVLSMINSVVIAGMGGYNIVEILEYVVKNKFNFGVLKQLVLQPQNNAVYLRKFLVENGFIIEFDEIVLERGKFYNVIRAVPAIAKKQKLSKMQMQYGLTNLIYVNPDFVEYLDGRYNQLESIIKTSKNKKPYIKEQKTIEKIVKRLAKLK